MDYKILFIIIINIIIIGGFIGIIIANLKDPQSGEAANLLEVITNNFGCLYCKNFYYNNDGSGDCKRGIDRPIYQVCFEPNMKKIEDSLIYEDCCDGTSSRED